jgi:Glycosyltransferase sugar-binding region containing DXD motif
MAAAKGTESGRTITQYWDSEEIPVDVAEMLASFRERNPELEHVVFSRASAERFIGERFGAREAAAFGKCVVPSVQSDYLRYCAVLALGGAYADVDMRCAGPLGSLLDDEAGGTLFGWEELPPMFQRPAYEWRERVGAFRAIPCGFYAFRSPGHPLLALTLEIATAKVESRLQENAAMAIGPGIFTALYFMRELGSLEAYAEYVRGGAFEPSARLLVETIGDYARVEKAFADVRIPSMAEAGRWVQGPGRALAYKSGPRHWLNSELPLFR